jgi:signal transduction histidine kinase
VPINKRSPRTVLLVVAAILFVAILVVGLTVNDARQAITLAWFVPIVLCALAGGLRGGLAGALVAIGLLVIWVKQKDVPLDTVGWVSRIISYLAIGALVGWYQQVAERLTRERLDERYALEIHDGVVQALVVATYELRAGKASEAGEAVEEALSSAKQIISERMPSIEPGDLRLSTRDAHGNVEKPAA